MRRIVTAFALLLMLMAGLGLCQESGAPLTNADVLQMMRSGLGRHTIVLLIRQGPCNFDTSPRAVIKLKKAGVSDEVINAMLATTRVAPAEASAEESSDALMLKAANVFGPKDQAAKIRAIRWIGNVNVTETSGLNQQSFAEERVEVYPDRVYLAMRSATGATKKLVVTPDLSYESAGHMTGALTPATAEAYRQQIRFDPPYVAQHLNDYMLIAREHDEENGGAVDEFKISAKGTEYVWNVDPQSGRLTSITFQTPAGEVTRQYSDYRQVADLMLPFKWRTTEAGRTSETTVSKYEVNPAIDESVFQPPMNLSAGAISLKVLQTESVPYTDDMGGDTSVNCQIEEPSNGRAAAAIRSLDNPVFADEMTNSDLKMVCNSLGTSRFFPHELSTMLVAGSDGKAYVIGCNKAWRWSKCYPLRTGEVFNASRTEKGLEIHGFDTKGGEDDATYSILREKTLQ